MVTSAAFTVGTIQRGARAGTRTTLASTFDCLIRAALKLCFSRKGAKERKDAKAGQMLGRAFAPLRLSLRLCVKSSYRTFPRPSTRQTSSTRSPRTP